MPGMIAAVAGAIVLLIATPCAPGAQSRLGYKGEPSRLRNSAAAVLEQESEQLLSTLIPGDRRAEPNRVPLRAVDDLLALANVTGEAWHTDRALLILTTIAMPYLETPAEEILTQITERGALDQSNLLMRDLAYDLARIYHLSGNHAAAEMAAKILARLADVMPEWPLVTPAGETRHQDDMAYRSGWNASGLWGGWYVSDLKNGLPLVRAFDLIHDSGAMQRLAAVETIERNIIRHMAEHYLAGPMTLGNLSHYALQALPLYGMAIGEPRYVHVTVQRYRYILNASYYADGFWHEGAPGYHKDITVGLTRNIPPLLKGYCDPPGYAGDIDLPRYDNLDPAKEYERQHKRMWAALKKLTFPNGDYAKIHDATYPHMPWWSRRPTHSDPRILGCLGHAILGTHAGADQAQLHLHYSGTHGHEHHDALNIILFARGKELISETQYRTRPDGLSTRHWHRSTAAHNTLVIDEENQLGRRPPPSHCRTITAADAMDGIPNWHHRRSGHGDALNDPKLRCFCPDWDAVQVAEAEAERAYFPDPQLYRRTVALVHIDAQQVYAVDIFRVRGGRTHDWMLHGCLQQPYELHTSVQLAPLDGTLHNYLGELQAAVTDGGWTATFAYEQGSNLRTHLLGQPNTRVIVGGAPAMRRDGYAAFLDARRDADASVFVAVHDPYEEAPNVESIEPVRWGDDPMNVALRIRLANGCVDIVLSSSENPPFAERTASKGLPGTTEVPGGIAFAGRFAHIRFRNGQLVHAYGVDASRLKAGRADLAGPGCYAGEIIATHRIEAGAEFDAFETDTALPTGLAGRWLVVDLGGVLTQAFRIDRIEPTQTGALIYSRDEPGLEIRGDLIKMMYYPGWGIPRPCRFHITDTLLWAADRDGIEPETDPAEAGR
jgi:hypothetical protein